MGDLGVNFVRREGEHYDVAFGLHADTGALYNKDSLKFYCFGLGGEAHFDKVGSMQSFGVGMGLLKLNSWLVAQFVLNSFLI